MNRYFIILAIALIIISSAATSLVLSMRQIAASETESRITAWIVERNPAATIKDFQGFPRVLLDESARNGIDYRLTMALIDKESEFKPGAIGKSGEIGLMQVMPSTAADVATQLKMDFTPPSQGLRLSVVPIPYPSLGTLGEPVANIRIGLAYLRQQVDRFGQTPEALRAYNRGPGKAALRWPADRYAEDVAFRFVALVHELPR